MLPSRWSVLKEVLWGAVAPNVPGTQAEGRRGVLPRRQSVLKEGLRGIDFHNRPGTPTWGDGRSFRGCGRWSRRACGG